MISLKLVLPNLFFYFLFKQTKMIRKQLKTTTNEDFSGRQVSGWRSSSKAYSISSDWHKQFNEKKSYDAVFYISRVKLFYEIFWDKF